MGRKRRTYSAAQLQKAVALVLSGQKAKLVSKDEQIEYSALCKRVKDARNGVEIVVKKRGPPPVLPKEAEQSIVEWATGMQVEALPVEPDDILEKASEVSMVLLNVRLGRGWLCRFLARNPQLTARLAQRTSRPRNEISIDIIDTLFGSIAKEVIERRLTADRIFNVDETAFLSRKKSRRVLAIKGSRNVWSKTATTNFHLSIIAYGSASGFVVPPAFILPGKQVLTTVLDACTVPGARVSTSSSGFVNGKIFAEWIVFFAENIPDTVNRPVVLVMDGYRRHYSEEVVEIAASVGVLLLCLPANATHLLQPIDVSVFSSLKKAIRILVRRIMFREGTGTISKPTAIEVTSKAWNSCNFGKNLVSGFETTGLFPANKVKMLERVARFQKNGVKQGVAVVAWLRHRKKIQNDVLTRPPVNDAPKKRK